MLNPLPIMVSELIEGIPPKGIERTTRKTYPFGCAVLLMFFRTLVTNSTAALPISRAVISQGPLMLLSANVSTTFPELSNTIRQPGPVRAPLAGSVGKLPTITQPDRSATSAVVRPTPPGQSGSLI